MHSNLNDENSNELNYNSNTNKNKDNNRFVISIGSLFILFTIYLSLMNVQRKFVNCYFYATNSVLYNPLINYPDEIENLDKEYNKLSVFVENDNYATCSNLPIFSIVKQSKIPNQQFLNDNSISKTKSSIHKNNKSVKLLKLTKTIDQKEEQKRKNANAEPIIYLFALTFIYLLLKAVSDLYQHYNKSETMRIRGAVPCNHTPNIIELNVEYPRKVFPSKLYRFKEIECSYDTFWEEESHQYQE